MIREEEIKRTINEIMEIIYEMYLQDLKIGNAVIEPIRSFGKICKKRNFSGNHEETNLFNYEK